MRVTIAGELDRTLDRSISDSGREMAAIVYGSIGARWTRGEGDSGGRGVGGWRYRGDGNVGVFFTRVGDANRLGGVLALERTSFGGGEVRLACGITIASRCDTWRSVCCLEPSDACAAKLHGQRQISTAAAALQCVVRLRLLRRRIAVRVPSRMPPTNCPRTCAGVHASRSSSKLAHAQTCR